MILIKVYIFFSTILYADQCLNHWYDYNIDNIDFSKIINIKSDIFFENKNDTNEINLYINRNESKIKVSIEDKIFFFDHNKSIKIYKSTNQMYIDYPDSNLIRNINFLFFEDKNYILNNLVHLDSCTYEFLYDNNFKLNFHKDCKKIDSIILNYYDRKIKLLNLETIFLDDDKKIFSIEGDFFEYDLR